MQFNRLGSLMKAILGTGSGRVIGSLITLKLFAKLPNI